MGYLLENPHVGLAPLYENLHRFPVVVVAGLHPDFRRDVVLPLVEAKVGHDGVEGVPPEVEVLPRDQARVDDLDAGQQAADVEGEGPGVEELVVEVDAVVRYQNRELVEALDDGLHHRTVIRAGLLHPVEFCLASPGFDDPNENAAPRRIES